MIMVSCAGSGQRESTVIRIGGPTRAGDSAQATRSPKAGSLFVRAPLQPRKVTVAEPVATFRDLEAVVPPEPQKARLLMRLIGSTEKSDPQMPDLLLRLGELYRGDANYYHRHGKANKAKSSLHKAAKIYNVLVSDKSYATYARADQALFGYALLLQGANRVVQSRSFFKKLIVDHPRSKYVPEAYLSFGDYFFAQGAWANAEKFYGKVLEFEKSAVHQYAMYKSGWVALRSNKPGDAIKLFSRVTSASSSHTLLRREAGRSLALAYASIGTPDQAAAYFDEGEASTTATLETLSLIYVESGDAVRAGKVLRELKEREPARACEFQAAIARSLVLAAAHSQAIDENKALFALLETTPSDVCSDAVVSVAHAWHGHAVASRDGRAVSEALALYAWLAAKTDHPVRAEALLIYADLTWLLASGEADSARAAQLWGHAGERFDAAAKAAATSRQRSVATKAANQARHNREVTLGRR